MLRGDISNQQSYVIGFRCEGSLLHLKEKGVVNKIANLFKGKGVRAEVDKDILSLMNYIYYNTEYTILLVIDDKNYSKEMEEYLSNFPFNQVCNIKSISEVTMMLNTGQLTVYVSNDILDRQRVNSEYALDFKTFNIMLRRRVKRF